MTTSNPGWGLGRYELTAARLEPAAHVAVDALEAAPGMRVLDAACGTGNAALIAARRGAAATGIDSAERLIDVARDRAAAEGLDATFEVGDVTAIRSADDAFDAAVSVFGVIFADPEGTRDELVRVVRPGGRIVLTTWVDAGPIPKAAMLLREALGGPPSKPTWSDPDYVRHLFAPRDLASVEMELAFTAMSAAEYVAEHAEHHPLWLMTEPALREKGRYADVLERATEIFEEANEDPNAFRTTSRYLVHTVTV